MSASNNSKPDGITNERVSNIEKNTSTTIIPEATKSQPEKGALTNPPHEWRASFNLVISGVLGCSIWLFLGLVAHWHFALVQNFSQKRVPPSTPNKEQVEQIDRAINDVNDTAKTLYAILTPLATAVTGYYFALQNNLRSQAVQIETKPAPYDGKTNS